MRVVRIAAHDAFDLGRIAVEPADDEHVGLAIRDAQIAGSVEDADVAGVQPAVAVDGLRGVVRVLEVAEHDVVAAHDDLAWLADGHGAVIVVHATQLDAGYRLAAGAHHELGAVAGAGHGHRAAGFRQTVARDHRGDAELAAHTLDHGGRHHARPRGRNAKRAQARAVRRRRGEQRLEERRRPGQESDLLGGHQLIERLHVHLCHRVDGGATNEGREPSRLVARAVKERIDDGEAIVLAKAHAIRPCAIHRQVLAMRGHHALRVPGGPRGEHDVGDLLAGQLLEGLCGRGSAGLSALEKAIPLTGAGGRGQPQAMFEMRQLDAFEQRRIGRAEKDVRQHQDACPAPVQDVCDFAGLEARIEGHDAAAGRLHAERGHDRFRLVRSPDGDAVALADTHGAEGRRGLQHLLLQLAIADAPRAVDDRRLVAMPPCRVQHAVRDAARQGRALVHGAVLFDSRVVRIQRRSPPSWPSRWARFRKT